MSDTQSIRFDIILSSDEYKRQLNNVSKEIIEKCKTAENEATVSSYFENALYHFIKTLFAKEIDFKKERTIGDSIRHVFSNKRMDAVINNLIVEYKHSSKLKTDEEIKHVEEQTVSYIQAHLKENINYEAIITDGIKVKFLYISNSAIKISAFSNLNAISLDRIVRLLLFFDKKKLAGSNIANDFKIDASNNLTKDLARVLFESIRDENIIEKTNMLFVEWRDLFHLSEADKGQNQDIQKRRTGLSEIFGWNIKDNDLEYKALFCLQTTYAIIVKLTAYKALIQLTNNDDEEAFEYLINHNSEKLKTFFQQLEDGNTYRSKGIRNLLEGDFFAWYCDDNQWNNQISNLIKQIIDLLIAYEDLKFTDSYEPQDLFKDLYLGTIPQYIRHSLGEYFTPAWLADSVIEHSLKLVNKDEWRGLDPCCGSGVFLIKMIEKILPQNSLDAYNHNQKKKILNSILKRVNGIDLNPLNVLTARVNYFIAILKLVDFEDEIEIPIYLGDSANLPTKIKIDSVNCYKYNIKNQKQQIEIILPTSFVTNKSFSKAMFSLQTFVKASKPEDISNIITEHTNKKDLKKNVLSNIDELSKNLVYLHTNKWDGIWVRIILNFLSIVKLGLFDIIVGNPPWVKWEYLPQTYAEKIKELCIEKHLFSGSVRTGGISLNVCALISNTAATNWLNKNDGILGFLMPKTLMTQQSYEGFRNFYLDFEKKKRLYFTAIDDWSEAGHPFVTVQEKFYTYFLGNNQIDYSKGIPVNNYVKNKEIKITDLNKKKDFELVKPFFAKTQNSAKQLSADRTILTLIRKDSQHNYADIIGSNFYKARSGAEFTPAELYFLKQVKTSRNKKNHVFKTEEFSNSKYKIIQKDLLELETEYIYPLVKGPLIKPFNLLSTEDFAIFPYNWGIKDTVGFNELTKKSKRLANYLLNYKSLIEQQSKKSLELSIGNEFYALSKIGDYTFTENLVAFRDNTKMAAAVVTKVKTPWNKIKMPVCAKHAPFISMTKTKRKITLDEAHYICGVLNTDIITEYMKHSNDLRSFSIDFTFKLPEYNSNEENFKAISSLSKKAHSLAKKEKDYRNELNQIQSLYLKICKLYK